MPYDPYANLGSTFNDLTRNLLTLRGQNIQQALTEAELGMRGRQLQETQRHNTVLEAAKNAEIAKDPNIMPLNRVDILKSKIGIKTTLGLDDKDLEDIYAPIMEMSGIPRGQAYDMLKAQGPQLSQTLLQRISGVYEKKLSDPKTGMTFAQSPQARAMEEFIGILDGDKDFSRSLDSLFPDVARARAEAVATRRAAQAPVVVVGEDGKPMYVSAEEAMREGYEKWEKPERAYKIGHVEKFSEGRNIVARMVVGYDQQGLPIFKEIARGEKDSPNFDNLVRSQQAMLYRQMLTTAQRELNNPIYAIVDPSDPNSAFLTSRKTELEQQKAEAESALTELGIMKPKGGKGEGVMKSMPPAGQHKGRTIRDTVTGKRYQSNGSTWVEIK